MVKRKVNKYTFKISEDRFNSITQKNLRVSKNIHIHSHRTHKNKGQEPVDPILYTNPSFAADWIRKEESHHTDDRRISDWTRVPPPIGAILDIGSEIDDFEALGASKAKLTDYFSCLAYANMCVLGHIIIN